MLAWMLGQRLHGRRQHTQASINLAYEPLEFRFASRYAYMLKIAAMVLVFAPAAPLLYFIGGGALLVWAAMQKLALCKIYRKPRLLDEKSAMRSRHFLHFLLAVHVVASPLFYASQAYSLRPLAPPRLFPTPSCAPTPQPCHEKPDQPLAATHTAAT